MSYRQPAFFYLLALVAVAILAAGVGARLLLWRKLGSSVPVPRGRAGWLDLLGRAFFQTRLLKLSLSRWLIHMAIFWGFLLLFAESLWLMVIKWGFPEGGSAALFFDDGGGRAVLDLWGDVWGVVLLVGLVAALVRRYVLRPAQLQTLLEDATALWFLVVVTLTGFAAEGVRMALEGDRSSWAFLGGAFGWVGTLFGIDDPMTLFWVHGGLSLLLIAYLPYGKLMHAFAAPVNLVLGPSASEEGEAV
ncbi:MAG: respiratory nitrate reductase subunit gamma [Thermoleophilia bacterium]